MEDWSRPCHLNTVGQSVLEMMEHFKTIHLLAEALVSLKHLQVVDHLNLDGLGGPPSGVDGRHSVLAVRLMADLRDVQVGAKLICQDILKHIGAIFLPEDLGLWFTRDLKILNHF